MRRAFDCNILLLLIILFVSSICFSQDAIITGRVRQGGQVLQGATVLLGEKTKATDQSGSFSFSVRPGRHTIIITHVGYKKIEQSIIAEAGQTTHFDFELMLNDLLEEVMIGIGSRSKIQRNNLNSPVPVDVYSYGRLTETGQITITQMLNFLAPSIAVSREVLNEPVTLRGLDPQHVLILVNGIRYHPMVWLFSGALKGQLGKGSVGNDLNSIPFPAIEKIEVLRDGAAAQYGSDAIAGVINIKLKEVTATSFHSQVGQFYKGDG
ncbi:MAG TPA: TonB-dependent receptor plug domain-containing protein, partial [Chitinophagaceae bacterium]